jgi:hypothetical protein
MRVQRHGQNTRWRICSRAFTRRLKARAGLRRWPAATVVFTVPALFLALLSAMTAQHVQQLANDADESKEHLTAAEAGNSHSPTGVS